MQVLVIAPSLFATLPWKVLSSVLLAVFLSSIGILIGFSYIEFYRWRWNTNTEKIYQKISQCNCHRQWTFAKYDIKRRRPISTCSDKSTWYKPFQNVISFSYFNIFKTWTKEGAAHVAWYKTGILENLRKMRQLYPGYTMRIYTNATLENGDEFCNILCSNSDVHWCDITRVPGYGNLSAMYPMTWRFLPMGDPSVNVFLSRDLDSVITEREVASVQDWLNLATKNTPNFGNSSKDATIKAIHVMRDHSSHGVSILGGLWGASNSLLGKRHAKTLQRLLVFWSKHPKVVKRKGFDQTVLSGVIFGRAKNNVVAYDSYSCTRFRKRSLVRPFPVKRKNAHSDFTGNPNFGRGVYKLEPCPVECRPEYGKDWEYC